MSPPSEASRKSLAAFMVGAGVLHFVAPRFYEDLIPDSLGDARAWVYGSGVAEIAAGVLVAVPRTSRVGAWATLAVLVGVYPGNVKMAIDAGVPDDAAGWAAWLRLPLQVPLWSWAWRHTRPPREPAGPGAASGPPGTSSR